MTCCGSCPTEGVAIWLDDLSRERVAGGNLATLVHDRHVTGIASNPTIFAKAMRAGTRYGHQITDLTRRGVASRRRSGC